MSSEMVVDLHPHEKAKHILVVEDNIQLRFVLAEWLRMQNYVVFEAASADEAVTVLSSPMLVDLVVTDVQMPGSMDGLGLVNYVAKLPMAIPVIVVSAEAMRPEIKDKQLTFLKKPYALESIATKIAHVLQKHTGQSLGDSQSRIS